MADINHPDHVDDFEHDGTVAHEHSDVNVRAIAAFVIGLFIVIFVAAAVVWVLMKVLEQKAVSADPAVSPLAVPSGTLPPEPRLLTNEPAALQQLRNEEDAALKDIERAKHEVVGTLPARADGKAPGESAARAASRMDTSSGRKR